MKNSIDPISENFLDITDQVCPMTFVRTKLLIERLQSGDIAEVRLKSGEPLTNVPRSLRQEGHEILTLEPEEPGSDIYRMRVRRK